MPTGILKVSTPLVDRARRSMPPEHSIRAIRDCGHYQDLLIEGPMMPGDEQTVWLLMMFSEDDLGGLMLRGRFTPIADAHKDATWLIGRWPSVSAFVEAYGLGNV